MSKREVYLHGEGLKTPQSIEVSAEMSISDVLKLYNNEAGLNAETDSNSKLYIENGEAVNHDLSVEEAQITDKSNIHCHRCEDISVTFFYNGRDSSYPAKPAFTGKKLKHEALHLYGITEKEGADMDLRIGTDNGDTLQDDDHIGAFVNYPDCRITLYLVSKPRIQG